MCKKDEVTEWFLKHGLQKSESYSSVKEILTWNNLPTGYKSKRQITDMKY